MKIYFVTGNKGKLEETKAMIPEIESLEIDLPEIQEMDSRKIMEYKLNEAAKHKQGFIMVEDLSFELDCLGGLPGPLIKWFTKIMGNEGLVKIVRGLGNDKARANLWLGIRDENGKMEFFVGTINGKIVEPRGSNGFGWDPVFQPDGFDKTFAEMTMEEKNNVSMRKIALGKLKSYLNTNVN